MTKEQIENFVRVATGKARVVRAKPELTAAQRFAKRLVEANRKGRAGMSEAQLQAGVIRGC
jgi:hypothetical protein